MLSERSRIGGRLISSDKEVSTGRWNHRSDSAGKLPSENGPYGKTEAVRRQSRNEAFPKSAKEGDANYTGGKEGSGQPALVYAAEIDLTSGKKEFTAKLIGHSSPDGSNGEIVTDTSSLTTALHIVKSITIHIQ